MPQRDIDKLTIEKRPGGIRFRKVFRRRIWTSAVFPAPDFSGFSKMRAWGEWNKIYAESLLKFHEWRKLIVEKDRLLVQMEKGEFREVVPPQHERDFAARIELISTMDELEKLRQELKLPAKIARLP